MARQHHKGAAFTRTKFVTCTIFFRVRYTPYYPCTMYFIIVCVKSLVPVPDDFKSGTAPLHTFYMHPIFVAAPYMLCFKLLCSSVYHLLQSWYHSVHSITLGDWFNCFQHSACNCFYYISMNALTTCGFLSKLLCESL